VGFKPRLCNEAQLRRIIQDVLQGLKWLHDHDYVHRDIRWDNIIIDKNGRAHLIDLEYAGKAGAVNFKLDHWPSAAASFLLVYSIPSVSRQTWHPVITFCPSGNTLQHFYPKTTDLYVVGQLMNEHSYLLEDSGLVFMQSLSKKNCMLRVL